MKLTLTSKTISFFSALRVAASGVYSPFTVLRAQEQLNKFRKLDDAALKDMGLTHADVERATLNDFLKMCQR